MGRPNISVVFKKLAETAKQRSATGIAVLIIKDDTDQSFKTACYSQAEAIESDKYTAANKGYIEDVLKGGVTQVIVSRVNVAEAKPVEKALENIGNQYYNWIALADGAADEQAKLVELVKTMPNISAVAYKVAADDASIINFTNEKVTPKEGSEITGEKYVARILGVICGCPLTESTTFKVLEDVSSVVEPANVDSAVDAGEFLLFNDDGVVRVARGVNSLQTLSDIQKQDMKKITIMETLTMIRRDVVKTFKDEYVGKYKNSYDNQVIFFSAIKDYLNTLVAEEILDKNSPNEVVVDVQKQREALIKINPEAGNWKALQVKNTTVGSNVYPVTRIRVNDAIEDMDFNVFV